MKFWTTIGLILVLAAAGLTYEIAAGRVLAPFFGTSLLTWTTVIATVLAGFSVGNVLGGLIAERDRELAFRYVRWTLVWTAVLAALSPTLLGLLYTMGARGTGGMFLSVVIAFFPASVLISTPSPFLAKLAVQARPGHEGSSLGLILAAGSAGAIFGAVLAGFVTLPFAGSVATFAGCGAVALLCALLIRDDASGDGREREANSGDRRESGAMEPGTVASLAAAALIVLASLTGGPACRYESGLSCIDIVNRGQEVFLYSDRTAQAAERITGAPQGPDAADILVLDYTRWLWERMDHDLGSDPKVLFIGGGGYTLPATLIASRPEAEAVAVEIDPLVTRVVREHMPVAGAIIDRTGYVASSDRTEGNPTAGRLGIVHDDGRAYLNETDRRFDAAVVDAFSSGSVPAHLATLETYDRLQEIVDGPVYVNLIDVPDGPLVRGVHAILSKLYPHVLAVQGDVSARGRANTVLAASRTALPLLDIHSGDFTHARITPARPFTDDRGWVGHR